VPSRATVTLMEAMGESDDVGTRTSEVFEGPSSERVMALLLFQADLKVGPLPTTNYQLPTTDYRLPTTDYRLTERRTLCFRQCTTDG
jgi:hypothetical protein